MRRIRNNSGFTLIECIIAMAVLATMSLLLMMVLNVTVLTRNNNRDTEREIDKQVEKIVAGAETETQPMGKEIVFKGKDGYEEAIPIPGANMAADDNRKNGLQGDKVFIPDNKAEVDILDYNFDNYLLFEDIKNAEDDDSDDDSGESSRKLRGAAANSVHITETCTNIGTDKNVTLNVKFSAIKKGDEIAIKVELPSGIYDISLNPVKNCGIENVGEAKVKRTVLISDNVVRIQPIATGDTEVNITYTIPSSIYDSAYVCVHRYFSNDDIYKKEHSESNDIIVQLH